jgi:hypothetical protein
MSNVIPAIPGTIVHELLTETVVAPDAWACALVNGDRTGLDEREAQLCEAFETDLATDGWAVYDVVRDDEGEPCEPWFTWNYRVFVPGADGACEGGMMRDYIIASCNPSCRSQAVKE